MKMTTQSNPFYSMRSLLLVGTLFALTVAIATSLAHAGDVTWSQTTAGTHSWGIGTNWFGGSEPGTGDRAGFRTVIDATVQTITLDSNKTLLGVFTNSNNNGLITVTGDGTNRVLNIGASGIDHQGGALVIGSATAGQQVSISLQGSQDWVSSASGTGAAAMQILNGVSIGSGGDQTLTLRGTNVGPGAPPSGALISGAITNGSATLSLTKADAGTWRLANASNTYTGNTTITGGTLKLSGTSTNNIAFSPAIVIGNGATLDATGLTSGNLSLAAGQTITGTGATGTITLNTGASATTVGMNGNNTISNNAGGTLNIGRISVLGTGNMITAGNIQSTVTTNRSLIIGNGSAGTLTISGGSFTSSSTQAALGAGDLLGNGAGQGTLIVNGGSYTNTVASGLGFGLGGGSPGAGVFTLTSGSANISTMVFNASTVGGATVNLDGGTLTLAAISNVGGNRTINFNGGTLKASGNLNITATSLASDVVNVKDGGAIIDTQTNSVTISSNLLHFAGATTDSLTKNGSGTLTLSGANTYSGNTTIANGTLALSTAGTNNISSSPVISLATSGASLNVTAVGGGFTLAATQTLAGIGTVQGNVALASGANLSPGLSPGMLTFANNLNLSATGGSNSGDLLFDLGSLSDLVDLTSGTLSIGTGTLGFNDFTFTPVTGFGPGTYTLFQTTQLISGTLDGGNLSGTVGGFGATLAFADGGTNLVLQVVPEPGSFSILALGGVIYGLMAVRKR